MSDSLVVFWHAVKPWLTQAMNGLRPIFELFEGPEPAIGISILMIGALALAWLFLVYRVAPMWWRVRRLAKLVRDNNETREQFKTAFPLIDEELRKPKFLHHAWMEFWESLIFPAHDSPDPIRNTVRPEFYLNVHAAEASGRTLRLLQSLPNYFVGLGLLFTFIGLVAALYFASEGVASDNVDEAKESLRHLLNAATFKFMTSIVGLASSIVLSFSYRVIVQNLQREFDRLCEGLERGLLFATDAWYAQESLNELKVHSEQLKRFNTDFAIEVGNVLRGTMSESLTEALGPLTAAIEGMTGNVGQMNQDALANMAKAFGEDLKGAAGSEMTALVSALEEIKGSLTGVVDQINATSSDFGNRMATSASRVEELLANAGDQLREKASGAASAFAEQMEGASNNLNASLGPLSAQIGRFEASIESLDSKIQAQRNAFQDVAEKVSDITVSVAGTIDDLRNASSPLAEVSVRFDSAAKEIRSAGEAITETQNSLRALAEKIGETTEAMESAWEDYRTRFEGVDKSLGDAIGQLVTGADGYREHVETFVEGLNRELDTAVRNLRGGIEGLKEAVEELIDLYDASKSS